MQWVDVNIGKFYVLVVRMRDVHSVTSTGAAKMVSQGRDITLARNGCPVIRVRSLACSKVRISTCSAR